jgi:hypothetical protein
VLSYMRGTLSNLIPKSLMVSKVPTSAKGAIGKYLYDFFYGREVSGGESQKADTILV